MAFRSQAQLPESFTRVDFELVGPVKTCVVKANYGQETFEFDRSGRLVKSLTRYSDSDYDITYYRYRDSLLSERRDEIYRNKAFDQQSSIAHIYKRDTADQARLVEKITSYDRSFQEQVAYYFGEAGRLERIVRTDASGVDETRLEYSAFKTESTASHYLNGQLHKTVRTSRQEGEAGPITIRLVKEFLGGVPQNAVERTLDADGKLIRETSFGYDGNKESFVPVKTTEYMYNEQEFTEQEKTTRHGTSGPAGEKTTVRDFVYQMDGGDPGNWIRKVIIPENTYIVRQIEYYEPRISGTASDSSSRQNP